MNALGVAARPGTMNEAKLAALLNDASIDQILALDISLHIIAWNKACEGITGIPRQVAIGRTFIDVHPKAADYPAIMEGIIHGLKGLKSFVSWEASTYMDGYFEHHFVPLKAEDGSAVGVLIVIHDVAHRIKAEQELKRLNAELAKKNKELQRKTDELANFNQIASHDLKEPLRKIYTFIEMVATREGQKISDTARSNLRRAQCAVQRMGLLTDDIVTFSLVTASNQQLARIDLQQALEEVKCTYTKTIAESAALVEAGGLPIIVAYGELVKLLMQHMLGNALKFQAGGRRPQVSITYSRVSGASLQAQGAERDAYYHGLCFKDNGIGFAQEYTERIFGMFQRLHPQGVFRGTGMGLPICRKVAEAHEGFIEVSSEEGAGSAFTCYLKDFGTTA